MKSIIRVCLFATLFGIAGLLELGGFAQASTGLACFMGTPGAAGFTGSSTTSAGGQSFLMPANSLGGSYFSVSAVDVNLSKTSGTANDLTLYIYTDGSLSATTPLIATSANTISTDSLQSGNSASSCDDATGGGTSVVTFTFSPAVQLMENTEYDLVLWQTTSGTAGSIWADRTTGDGAPNYAGGQWSRYNSPPIEFGSGGGSNNSQDYMFEVIGDEIPPPTPTPTPTPLPEGFETTLGKPAIQFLIGLVSVVGIVFAFGLVVKDGKVLAVIAGLVGVIVLALLEQWGLMIGAIIVIALVTLARRGGGGEE